MYQKYDVFCLYDESKVYYNSQKGKVTTGAVQINVFIMSAVVDFVNRVVACVLQI
jgi:hypothetical protein